MLFAVYVKDCVAKYTGRAPYVCGNAGEEVKFYFNDFTTSVVKTARFKFRDQFVDVPFSGDTVEIPVINDADYIEVGVYVAGARVSTDARIPAVRGTMEYDGYPPAPPADTYQEFMAVVSEVADRANAAAALSADAAENAERYASDAEIHAQNAANSAAQAARDAADAELAADNAELAARNAERIAGEAQRLANGAVADALTAIDKAENLEEIAGNLEAKKLEYRAGEDPERGELLTGGQGNEVEGSGFTVEGRLQTAEKRNLIAAINEALNSGGGSVTPEQIAAAVEAYMAAHPITENDPTVPDWAKAATKPSYTASEVGAEPAAAVVTRGEVVMFGLNSKMTASGIKANDIATKADIEAAIAVIDGIADDIMGITDDILEVL